MNKNSAKRKTKSDSINFRCYEKDKKSLKSEAQKQGMCLADYVMMLHRARKKWVKNETRTEEMRLLLRTIEDEFYDLPEFKKYYNERIEEVCRF